MGDVEVMSHGEDWGDSFQSVHFQVQTPFKFANSYIGKSLPVIVASASIGALGVAMQPL